MPAAVPVRILYVEGNYDGSVGGSYYSLLFLLEHLDRTQFDSVLVLRGESPLTPRFKAAAGSVRIIKRWPPFQAGLRHSPAARRIRGVAAALGAFQSTVNFLRFYARVVWLSDVIRREDAQLVHLNNSVTSNHDWMLAAMMARVPCITHERGLNERYSSMARFCARWLARIICISQAVFDKLVEHGVGKNNLVMIHNGLDPASMTPGRSAEDVRRTLDIAAGRRVIGLVGNIRAWKGQEVVIRALPAIVQRIPNLTCLFVGEATGTDHDYETGLHALVAELGVASHVVFTGYCENVADVLNVMDVSIHASVTPEPFGRVLLEAMAMRKPVVGSRGGAVTEIVVDGVTGFTFAPGNSADLAARVIELLEQPDKARAFGEAGHARLMSDFQLTTNVARTMAVYEDILQRRN